MTTSIAQAQDCVDCTKNGQSKNYLVKQGAETALSQQLDKIVKTVEEDLTGKNPIGLELNAGYWTINESSEKEINATHHTWNGTQFDSYGFKDKNLSTANPGTPADVYLNLVRLASNSYQSSQYKADNSQQFMEILKTEGSGLPLELQIQLLKQIGAQLGAAYDKTMSPDVSINPVSLFENAVSAREDRSDDEIYKRLRSTEGSVGVCRQIHRYLRDMAQSLGLQSQTITVDWRQNGESGGHLLSTFKDPKTGKVFIQNYSTIIEINNTDESSARPIQEAVSQIISGTTAVSISSDGKNPTHTYLTDTGKLMISGIEKADQLIVHPHEDVAVKIEQQTSYSGVFTKIPLEKRAYRSKWSENYIFLGGQNIQNHPTLPNFTQGFVGFGQRNQFDEKLKNKKWSVTDSDFANIGIQSVKRYQLPVKDLPKNEGQQSEEHLYLNFGYNREYKLTSINQKNTLHLGNEIQVRWSDIININGSKGDLSHSSPPYNWIRPYIAGSKKIAEKTGVGFQVSEVIQLGVVNLSTTKLGFQHQYLSGEVEIFHAGKDLFLRANEKLYVMPGAGYSHRSSIELMQTLIKGKKAQLTMIGTGTIGANIKDSSDQWYSLKPYETGRAELQISKKINKGHGLLQLGGGVQYQGNTTTNTFDPLEMKNIQQFIDNPKGQSNFVYFRLKI